jgi:hypothetical protein
MAPETKRAIARRARRKSPTRNLQSEGSQLWPSSFPPTAKSHSHYSSSSPRSTFSIKSESPTTPLKLKIESENPLPLTGMESSWSEKAQAQQESPAGPRIFKFKKSQIQFALPDPLSNISSSRSTSHHKSLTPRTMSTRNPRGPGATKKCITGTTDGRFQRASTSFTYDDGEGDL